MGKTSDDTLPSHRHFVNRDAPIAPQRTKNGGQKTEDRIARPDAKNAKKETGQATYPGTADERQ
jgi:hypothetical protein